MLDIAALKALADKLPEGLHIDGSVLSDGKHRVWFAANQLDVLPIPLPLRDWLQRTHFIFAIATHFKELVADYERLQAENERLRDLMAHDERQAIREARDIADLQARLKETENALAEELYFAKNGR